MHSCIYEGSIQHRRQEPVVNHFKYRVYMLYLDLDEIDGVFDKFWLWSSRRPALARFDFRDHLVNLTGVEKNADLRPRILDILKNRGIDRAIGPVRLLTQLQYFFLGMNPVSFYYCYDPAGEVLEAVVAEVNNTPWGEQHIYVIDGKESESNRSLFAYPVSKEFHVSPFMPLDLNYSMRFSNPEEKLSVGIENFQDDRRFFDVGMTMERRPITSGNLARVLVRYPFISFKVVAAIYWQAFRLWFKKCPFIPHPRNKIEPINGEPVSKETSELVTNQ